MIEEPKVKPIAEKIPTIKKLNTEMISPREVSGEKTVIDTIKIKQEIKIPSIERSATSGEDLKFAANLLDTFLVRNPEYARFILQQQAKILVKIEKRFTRYELERKINKQLHEYIQKNFPEGSEHAMNPNVGPGMQIPIDGLIDAIKDIFK